jgi:hypothetical protein
LQRCNLGNEGVSLLVDALEGNTTITHLSLNGNGITACGVPHLIRLVQHSSARCIVLDSNPGPFDNEESTRFFFLAVRNANLLALSLNLCQLPGHAVISLFQAVANNDMLERLCVYDRDQLEESHLGQLLETIPQIRNIQYLQVNLNFTNDSVLSSFRRNTSILYLCGENSSLVTTGAIADTLKRNDRINLANQLLNCEPQRVIPLGLWANGIARITYDSNGATAAYKILHQKLFT